LFCKVPDFFPAYFFTHYYCFLFNVDSDPNEPLERLRQKLIVEMKQIVTEAVEKAIYNKCNNKNP
jgi:hypothetical protein